MTASHSSPRPPIVACWGMGLDSIAMIIELVARGEPPDVVLTADTGSERPETMAFLPLFQQWMDGHGLEHHVVRYVPKRFKHWPPYYSLLENCLPNATLPSISMGRHSCSQKWKIEPQDRWTNAWPPALSAWARGQRVTKLIGYDASPADDRRYAHVAGIEDPKYAFRYPLREWGWQRDDCAARIRKAGLPVPMKSACFFCGAAKPDEIATLPHWCLRLIVLIETRAAPRLRTVEGLWRSSTKTRPGSMTAFIRLHALLDTAEIDDIVAGAPVDLVRFQDAAAALPIDERPALGEWIERFNAGVTQLAA